MYGIGRAEAARFERHSRCFELHSRVLRATQQKGARAVSVIRNKFPHFLPRGSGAPPDLSFTPWCPAFTCSRRYTRFELRAGLPPYYAM
jgi:hypothetical protein